MKNKIVFLCGPHTTGKTTILRTLKAENFFQEIGSEIGKDLYYERKLVTSTQDENFEWEVCNLELERDKKFSQIPGLIGIETWHPGNLAYAAVRNPAVIEKLAQQMKKSPLLNSAVGIYLDIPREVIFERTKTFQNDRDWAADFYSKINSLLPQCIEMLGLTERVFKMSATENFDVVLSKVRQKILQII